MRVRPIHFVPDVDEAMRFYEALGLKVQARARTGHWIELTATGGELALHDSDTAADGHGREGMLVNFIAEEPLETLTFAMLTRGDLRLALSAPSGAGGGGQAMPDGTEPAPGGWNRLMLEVDDLDGAVELLRKSGARFRNDIVTGFGGKQILLEDPSGNPIELFEPTRPEARLSARG
jgi:catechol 2,3-dioxygenase-like lactoylglutathione lyase family enzyme